jgi:5-methylcytosine-specific restriction endonuclease McrA
MSFSLSDPVLVLNANFEPLNVCTIRRAMGLIISDKATMILDGRGEVHSVSNAFPAPSVIRLERMIRRPRPRVKLTKQEIFRRDNYTCQYCGKQPHTLTIDHIYPRRLGGKASWDNLVTACPACNHRKGGRTLEQANMRLLQSPTTPSASARYIFGRYLKNNSNWLPYVDGW